MECEPDKQGRVPIPPGLREYAGLGKEVLWAGMGRTAELWSRELGGRARVKTDAELMSFKAAIAEQIRL